MARGLTPQFVAEAEAASNRPVVFFEGRFKTSVLRLWNGFGDLAWAANTWQGNGWFQGLEGTDESTEVEATSMTVVLSGVPAAVLSLVLGDQKQNARGNLSVGFLTAAGAVVPDPYLWWSGKYSHAEVADGADEATVRLVYESELVDLDRAREGRWTHDGQQRLFAGDLGFQYVVAASAWDGSWGGEKKKVTKNNRRQSDKPKGSAKRGR